MPVRPHETPSGTPAGTPRPAADDLIAAGLLAAVAAWVAAGNWRYSYDDAFITFRMAAHFADGRGFVYNPGEWHLGSTAALWGLTLGVLGKVAGAASIPAIAGILSSLAMWATGLVLYALGRGRDADAYGRATGLAAGLLYVASPMMFVTYGGEMPALLALIAGGFLAADRDRPGLASALGALAALTRPDGVLALGLILALIALRNRRLPWREAAVAGALLLPAILLAWYCYGTPLPSTLQAKLAQRDSGLWGSYGRGLVDWLVLFLWNDRGNNLGFAPVNPPTLWLWTAIGAAGVWRARRVLPLLAWSALFVAAYAALRVPFYHWYAAPAVLGLSILAGAGLAAVLALAQRTIARAVTPRALPIAAAAAAIAISVAPIRALPRTSRLNDNVRLYIQAGHWLAAHTPRESRVGYYEIGYIGFYGDRPMVDALGLIDPAVSRAVVTHDFAKGFRDARPDYILEKPGAGLNTFLAEPWFAAEYALLTELRVGGEGLRIHRRRPTPGP